MPEAGVYLAQDRNPEYRHMTVLIQRTTEIHRPLGEVFAFVSDQRNDTQWRTGLHAARKLIPGEIRSGSLLRLFYAIPGRSLTARSRVTTFVTNREMEWEHFDQRPLLQEKRRVIPIDGGTRFTCTVTFNVGATKGIAGLLTALSIAFRLGTDVRRLKSVLERTTSTDGEITRVQFA